VVCWVELLRMGSDMEKTQYLNSKPNQYDNVWTIKTQSSIYNDSIES